MTFGAREDGFTLVEILMVIVICGVLAAIAIPSFLSQRQKGFDAAAQSDARTAETAMAVYRTDHDTYACGTSAACVAALRQLDDSIPDTLAVSDEDGTGSPSASTFRVTAQGGDTRTFWISHAPGRRTQGCDLNGAASHGACRAAPGATAGSW